MNQIKLVCLSLILVFFSGGVFAQGQGQDSGVRETGQGQAWDFCDDNFGYSCMDRVKFRAKRAAADDLQRRCSVAGRVIQSGSLFCNAYCVPNYIPPDSGQTYVRCDGRCEATCVQR